MTPLASQITSLVIVYSIVYSDADQRKHQSSASLAFVWGIHRDRWIPRTKGQLRGKCFHLMTSSWFEPSKSNLKYILSFRSASNSRIHVVLHSNNNFPHILQVFDLLRLRDMTEFSYVEADYEYTLFGNSHNIVSDEVTGYVYAVGSWERFDENGERTYQHCKCKYSTAVSTVSVNERRRYAASSLISWGLERAWEKDMYPLPLYLWSLQQDWLSAKYLENHT